MHQRTRNITNGALFLALGLILPPIFHMVGLGPVFLPMMWPLAVGVFFLPAAFAVFLAVFTPILSMFITGMPPVPVVYLLMAQLIGLGATAGWYYRATKHGIFWPLLFGLVVSQLLHFVMVIPLADFLGLPPKMASVAYLARGVPGLFSILIIVPILVNRIKKQPLFVNR
ncbi:hypothetical protein JW935_24840, partial [candidate division KSB1 bacterium]|nr:hypothetical protein [candidate division KSB1 bacterium]